jgi:glycogen debranching enzyme
MTLAAAAQSAEAMTDHSPTASLQERRPRMLKDGDMFAMFDAAGNIPAAPGSPDGIYYRDTRHLAHLDLLIGGQPAMLLSSSLRDDNAALTCDLTNAELDFGGTQALERNTVHLRRTKLLFDGVCHERIAIRNHATSPARFDLEFRFDGDFADLFEARGRIRRRHGTRHRPIVDADTVLLAYTGLDLRRRETRLQFEPAPRRLDMRRAVFDIDLPAGGATTLYLAIGCDTPQAEIPVRVGFFRALRAARRARRGTSVATVESDNAIFTEGMRRSVVDLAMLVTDTPQGPYPYAGIPWFSTAFGRDGLITALLTLWMDPDLSRGVLRFLAARQAIAVDAFSDAEPGKILHEMRQGEMAELGEVPYKAYYGSVDSTPLFVILAGAYLDRTGDIATLRALWPNIVAALGWIDSYGDPDGDGFLEYQRQAENGLANQGWKDSADSVFHADGALAASPIALCEAQGYAFAARRAAATIAHALGETETGMALDQAAERLRLRIEDAFWCSDIGTYAMALDRDKTACRVRASNAGHLLFAGVATPERAALVAGQLLSSAFLTGWGVRTLAAGEARFNPMSYHNGSVWPHDTALIGLGFARYGMREEAARLLEGLFAASVSIDLRRLPELICGFARREGQGPTFYPVACSPQAWAAASMPGLLQACLGLRFDPAARNVHFDRPVLPRFTDRVVLRGLAIGDARIDVALEREGGSVRMRVVARSGDIDATVTV